MAGLIDRAIGAVSPSWAVTRAKARLELQATTAASGFLAGRGGYKAASGDRRQTRGWGARVRTANEDYLPGQRTLIARSRDAAMNMPLGTAAIERRVSFSIGSGLMAIPEIPEELMPDADARAELTATLTRDFDAYMASTDPDAERTATGYDLQAIVLRGQLEGGDILTLRVMPDKQPGRQALTAFKLVEAERVATPVGVQDGVTVNGKRIIGGVELDAFGAAVAFHVIKPKPLYTSAGLVRAANDTQRIEAWGRKTGLPSAWLTMSKRRPDQTRGVPLLAPVLETLRQVSDLTEAELFAAVLQGMLAIIYKSPNAQPMPEPDYGTAAGESVDKGLDEPSEPLRNYRMESGSVLEIDAENEAEMVKPGRPNPAFDPFFVALAKQIGAAINTPVEILLMAFNSSYSASRAAIEVFYTTVVRPDREAMASLWCAIVYQLWLFEQVARGRYRLPGFLEDVARRAAWSAVRFRGDGKISLNMLQEAKGYEVYQAHGWMTGAQITADVSGGDYQANTRARGAEQRAWTDEGLPTPMRAGVPAGDTAAGSERKDDE